MAAPFQFSEDPVHHDDVLGPASRIPANARGVRSSIDLSAFVSSDHREHGVGALLDQVLTSTITLTQASAGAIQLLNGQGGLEIVAHRGLCIDWVARWQRVAVGEGASGTAMRDGARVVLEDIDRNASLSGVPILDELRRAGVRAVQATPIRDSAGAVMGVLSTHHRGPVRFDDRLLRMLDQFSAHCATVIEQALGERQRIEVTGQRAFFDQVPFAMVMLDREMHYMAVSRRWREDYGLGDRPLVGESHYAVFPEIGEPIRAIHRRALAGESCSAEAEEFVRTDGRVHWLRWKVVPWRAVDGTVGGIILFTEDVTTRVLAEGALRDSEYYLHRAKNVVGVGTWEWNVLEKSSRWSDQTFHLYGLLPGAVSPSFDAWLASVHPEDRDTAAMRVANALASAKPIELEWRTAGQDRWLLCRGQPEFDQSGAVRAYLGIVLDITDRKHAQFSLERTRHLLTEREGLAHVGSFDFDVRTGETHWSAEQFRIHGLDPAAGPPSLPELLARWVTPGDVEALQTELLNSARGRTRFEHEHRIVRPDGGVRWLRTHAAPEFDANGELRHYLGTTLDITDLREAERRARERMEDAARLQRLNTADELAGVLSHELNHPLGTIAIQTTLAEQLLQTPVPDLAALGAALQSIQTQTRRAAEIVRHMRRHITREPFIAEAVDLNAVVRGAWELMEGSARVKNIRLKLDLSPDLPPVIGADVQIEQVLLNLIRNALEAVEGAGLSRGEVRLRTRVQDTRVRITISDNGPGLVSDEVAELFGNQPSRKPGGLGLGLRISRSLVEAHGGTLWIEAHAPGAILHVELPAA